MVTDSSFFSSRRGFTDYQFSLRKLAAVLLACVFIAPVFAIVITATGDSGGLWGHLAETVLPRYVINTLILMVGVGFVALIFGISTAWIVVRYDFFPWHFPLFN